MIENLRENYPLTIICIIVILTCFAISIVSIIVQKNINNSTSQDKTIPQSMNGTTGTIAALSILIFIVIFICSLKK